MIFLAIIGFIIALIVKLHLDVKLYNSGGINKHQFGPAIVVVILILCSYLAGWASLPMWFFAWWSIFDSAYAVSIKQNIFYIGTTAWLDKLQRKYRIIQWLKYIFALALIILWLIHL